jgi:hypothetical protein
VVAHAPDHVVAAVEGAVLVFADDGILAAAALLKLEPLVGVVAPVQAVNELLLAAVRKDARLRFSACWRAS